MNHQLKRIQLPSFILKSIFLIGVLFTTDPISAQNSAKIRWVEVPETGIPLARQYRNNVAEFPPSYIGANTIIRNADEVTFDATVAFQYVQLRGDCGNKSLIILKIADFDKNGQPKINIRKPQNEKWFIATDNYEKILGKACSLANFSSEVKVPTLKFDYKNPKDSGTIQYKGVQAILNYSKKINENGRIDYLPMLTVLAGRQVIKVEGKGNIYRSSMVQIAEMDKSNPFPEVIFSSYTGGTHCCTVVKIITSNSDGSNWKIVDVGRFDGTLFEVKDPDGSGLYYYITDDDRFKYKFSSYAGSYPPMRVWQLNGLEIKDVSKESRFYPLHRQTLQRMWRSIDATTKESEINGILAGYVATKAILNETISGWELMLTRYDSNRKDGLEECKAGYDDQNKCNDNLIKYFSFPEALRAFLITTGYLQP